MAAAKKPAAKKPPARAASAESGASVDLAVDVLEGIRAEIGDEGAQLLGSDAMALKIRGVISTQCVTLDAAIGRGGIPLGRVTILHGGEGSGKTTLALHAVAETQALGGVAVYVDKEYKLDPDYAAKIGVDNSKLVISQPGPLEEVIKVIEGTIKRAAAARVRLGRRPPILIVIDSLNACMAKAVLEGDAGDSHIATEARLWSRHMPKIVEEASKEDVAILFISQVRKKIGVFFGNDEDMAGGQAPRFYASLIMYVKKVGTEKADNVKVANKIEVECKKNQISQPFRKANFQIAFGRGIDFENSLITQAVSMNILDVVGTKIVYEGEVLGNGMNSASKFLRKKDNHALRDELNKKVRAALGW